MQNLTDWQLSCFYPYVPYYAESFEVGISQKSILPPISAKVPGSVQKALMDAGLLEDPYFEMNSLKAEWVENKWWIYSTEFEVSAQKKYELVFESIDYKAKVFLNGKLCGESENMFVPLKINTDGFLLDGKNNLLVVLEGAPSEMAQLGYSEKTHTQKSRFNYKWDFGTRLVHLGLVGKVYLREIKPIEFDKLLFNGKKNGEFSLSFIVKTSQQQKAKISIKIKDKLSNTVFDKEEEKILYDNLKLNFEEVAKDIALWSPQGYGDQNLYTLTVEINDFSQTLLIGFKSIYAVKNSSHGKCPYPYQFIVNDKPIYVKGVNLTPLDLLYGDILDEKYEKLLKLIKEANVNLIRVWGGGRIETEKFYELCDQYGIMVWQEFPQSGAGISSLPSVDLEYLKNLKRTAETAVFKANHVSLVAFSGGNELSDKNTPVDFSNENIAMLKEIVEGNCPWVLMYPTSGAGGWPMCDLEHKGNLFDVHGPWQYYGNNHYKLFNQSDSVLHSEFGCDGMTNLAVIQKYFSKQNITVSNMTDNYSWRHHGEWWDTYKRDTDIFYAPKTIEEQIALSQFMQAEGLRYAIEANRRRAYQNCGSIIWQANEPYPNVSCTNLIDYFNRPKFVYYAIKQAFNKVNPSLQYDNFIYAKDDILKAKVFVTADGEICDYVCLWEILVDGNLCEQFSKKVVVGDGLTKEVGKINFVIPKCDTVLVKMFVRTSNVEYSNSVLFPIKNGEKANIEPVIKFINSNI